MKNRIGLANAAALLLLISMMAGAQAGPPKWVFVTNEKDDTVSVIDGATNTVVATIPIGARPRGIGVAPDGSEVYVAISEANAIAVFDPETFKVLRQFDSGDDPETFAVHPNGNIYISNEDDAKASVFNPRTGELVAEIKVGIEPEGVAISPDGSKVIVTSESTNMLHVIPFRSMSSSTISWSARGRGRRRSTVRARSPMPLRRLAARSRRSMSPAARLSAACHSPTTRRSRKTCS